MKKRKLVSGRKSFYRSFTPKEQKNLIISSVILFVVVFVFILTFSLSDKPPVIKSITPSIAVPGDQVVIEGDFLNSIEEYDVIEFAGKLVSSNYIKEWGADRIILQVPPSINSGMVYIVTQLGRSNGELFTNGNHIPGRIANDTTHQLPFLFPLRDSRLSPGELLTLKGTCFGLRKFESEIYLQDENRRIALSREYPQLLELWSDHEVHIRMPDFKIMGTLLISSPVGDSNAVDIEIFRSGGSVLESKIDIYDLQYQLSFYPIKGELPKAKGIVVFPKPFDTLFQSSTLLATSQRVKSDHDLWSRLNFNIASDVKSMVVSQDVRLKRKAFFTDLDRTQLKRSYDLNSSLVQFYIDSHYVEQQQSKLIKDIAYILKKKKVTPIDRAEVNYNYVIDRLEPLSVLVALESPIDIKEAVESKKGNPLNYSSLFVALCRNQGIPARLFSGLIESRVGWVAHSWAEFYIDGFGWIPVDPYLADTIGDSSDYFHISDKKSAYFGSIDSRRMELPDFEFPKLGNNDYSFQVNSGQNSFVPQLSAVLSQPTDNYRIEFKVTTVSSDR